MKRSEWLSMIENVISKCNGAYNSEEMACKIIEEQESAGMLPVPDSIDWGVTDNILYATYNHGPMRDCENIDVSLLWEKEDE